MRTRTILAAVAATALSVGIAPAQAEEQIPMGSPSFAFRYNDGEIGVVNLVYGPDARATSDSTRTDRPMNAECEFAIEANVGSSVINVDVVAFAKSAPFVDGLEVVRPVSTGVRCAIKYGPNNVVAGAPLETAGESAVGAGTKRYVITDFRSPITLCATPVVHWSDLKYQIGAEECETS